jgi:hypothetical protein
MGKRFDAATDKDKLYLALVICQDIRPVDATQHSRLATYLRKVRHDHREGKEVSSAWVTATLALGYLDDPEAEGDLLRLVLAELKAPPGQGLLAAMKLPPGGAYLHNRGGPFHIVALLGSESQALRRLAWELLLTDSRFKGKSAYDPDKAPQEQRQKIEELRQLVQTLKE